MASQKIKQWYSADEVDALLDFINEKSIFIDKERWLVRYCDLDRAFCVMPRLLAKAIFYVGVYQLPVRDAGKAMGVGHDAAWKRYKKGVEWIVDYLNTGKVKH